MAMRAKVKDETVLFQEHEYLLIDCDNNVIDVASTTAQLWERNKRRDGDTVRRVVRPNPKPRPARERSRR